jgi:hypothetical protein
MGSADGDKDEGAERLYRLVEYLEDGVKIVRLNVQSDVNAYTVFETLNDRGLDLSVLDLAKNHLFGRASDPTVLRACYEPVRRMLVACLRKRQANATK